MFSHYVLIALGDEAGVDARLKGLATSLTVVTGLGPSSIRYFVRQCIPVRKVWTLLLPKHADITHIMFSCYV